MKPIASYKGKILQIIQPKFIKQDFEFRSEDEIIAKIKLKGVFKPTAEIDFGKYKWEFFKPSFWQSEIGIRLSGNEMPFARFVKESWKNDGTLELPKGDRLKISFNKLKGTFRISNLSGKQLVYFNEKSSLKNITEVIIENESELLEKFPWTIIFAWFIANQNRQS